jgi:RNA polymerase sigma-70 factor (ECF subfamily)
MSSNREITELLHEWGAGNEQALEKLTPLLYKELHRIAHRYMEQERPEHTLQTTALINEAYLRLIDRENVRWQNRAHFLGVSALLMRRILVDSARSRKYAKRGGGVHLLSLEAALTVSHDRARQIVAVDEALQTLETFDPRKCRIAELRFFGGLTVEEIAHVLKVSVRTIFREWDLTKAWLTRELSSEN